MCGIYSSFRNSIKKIIIWLKTIIGIFFLFFIEKDTLPSTQEKKIFIIGNGPSAREQILANIGEFQKTDIFAMNYMANNDFYELIKPKYYIICDPNEFTSKELISKELQDARMEGWMNIVNKTTWHMSFFIPKSAYGDNDLVRLLKMNDNISICYYNDNSFVGIERIKNYVVKNGYATFPACTVLIPAIVLSLCMQYKKLYIFGAEHSWAKDMLCDENNNVCLIDRHSYGVVKRLLYKDNYGKEKSNMYTEMTSIANVFLQHMEISKFATYCGANIYNVTPCSFIDAYKKIRINDIS